MTQIKAEIIADSKNEFGNRITTMIVTFPRYILAEFNTHRMLSKNSASSRAIPFEKMVKSVEENPFIPIAWMKDHKGMQGTEYWTEKDEVRIDIGNEFEYIEDIQPITEEFKIRWLEARDKAVNIAIGMNDLGLTKQLCNRLLEPFMWHTVIVTGTEWENFFALRCPQYWLGNPLDINKYRSRKDAIKALTEQGFSPNPSFDTWDNVQWLKFNEGQADIHMMALAEAMWDAMNESTPNELKAGEWHIPFGENIDEPDLMRGFPSINERNPTQEEIDVLAIKVATARCARVSYTIVGEESKEPNYENDIKLHDKLLTSGHMSPFEHCAKAMDIADYRNYAIPPSEWSGNFRGFVQYRKTIPNENVTK